MLSLPAVPKRKKLRLFLRAAFLTVGVVAAVTMSILFEEKQYRCAMIPAAFLLLASLAEFVLADIITESVYPARTEALLDKLEDNLRGYHDNIRESIGRAIGSLRACDKSRVSGTFHLIVDRYSASGDEVERALVQVTSYSGKLGGKRWRFTAATEGVVGRCLRTGRVEWVNFSTAEDYRERMVREFGFSSAEVEQLTKEARSYWARPVFSRKQIVGILYLFSTELQVFPHAIDETAVDATSREIAAFLEGAGIFR